MADNGEPAVEAFAREDIDGMAVKPVAYKSVRAQQPAVSLLTRIGALWGEADLQSKPRDGRLERS